MIEGHDKNQCYVKHPKLFKNHEMKVNVSGINKEKDKGINNEEKTL